MLCLKQTLYLCLKHSKPFIYKKNNLRYSWVYVIATHVYINMFIWMSLSTFYYGQIFTKVLRQFYISITRKHVYSRKHGWCLLKLVLLIGLPEAAGRAGPLRKFLRLTFFDHFSTFKHPSGHHRLFSGHFIDPFIIFNHPFIILVPWVLLNSIISIRIALI